VKVDFKDELLRHLKLQVAHCRLNKSEI
jgi:hypothetical protein